MKKWLAIAGVLLLTAIVALVSMQFVSEEKRFSVLIVIGVLGAAAAAVVAFISRLPAFWATLRRLWSSHDETPQVVSPLHQLPPPVKDFTGREEELAELLKAVRKGGATISGVLGMGGVGKTELAKVLAHELRDDFPDAQIFLDLKGTAADKPRGASEESLTPAEALAYVVQAFHPEDKLPDDDNALRGLFCSVLEGKKALLVMDNAQDRSQVEPLIPPARSVLIVTSRQHFALPGIHTKNLDALPMEKAVKLLVRIARRIEPRAEEVAELCARLPLALRAAGRALVERPDLTPDDLVKRLEDKKRRLKLTGAGPAIAASYDLLKDQLRARWRLLAVFPGDFDVLGAAAVWDIPLDEADEAKDSLSALRRASMLEWNEATGRYRLHDLARDFAESRLQRARAEAEKRHAEHYERVLRAADELYKEGGDGILRALALFDRERENIEAGQAWAAAHAEEDEAAARLASGYPDAGAYVLNLRQHPRQWIRWLESAVAAARRLKHRKAEGTHLGNLGNATADLGETRKAIESHEAALEISRELKDRRGEGQDLGNLGLATAALGETRKAIEYYERRLEIARTIEDRLGEAQDCWNLGLAYEELGEFARAAELMQVCVDYERELGHPDAEKRAAWVEEVRKKMRDAES